MSTQTKILIIVLSSVFGFLLSVFLFLIVRFSWRMRRSARRAQSSGPEKMQSMQAHGAPSSERRDRWSTNKRGSSHLEDVDDSQEAVYNDRTASEFGATVHPDGTRSYLNGWYAHSDRVCAHRQSRLTTSTTGLLSTVPQCQTPLLYTNWQARNEESISS